MGVKLTSSSSFDFQGGIDEVHSLPNLTPVAVINEKLAVGLSQAQNVRPLRPEYDQRGGMSKHHSTTAHATKEITSMFGFSKGRISEVSLFAQYDDGSVEKGDDNPPTTTTGNFSSIEALEENYEGSQNTSANVFGDGGLGEAQAQEFKVSTEFEAIKVSLSLRKAGSPTDNITVRIETDNAGLPSGTLVDANATSTIAASSLTASYAWEDFTFPDTFTLSTVTVYHLVLVRSGARDEVKYCQWAQDNSSPSYADGEREKKDNGTWANDATSDLLFRVYSLSSIPVLAARANSAPGAFATLKDYMLYADGAGAAQIYTGANAQIYAFNVYKGNSAIPTIPEEGADYTQEVTDGLATTFADLGSLDKLADNHALFVITDVPVDKLSLAFSAWNSTEVGDLAVKYWNGTTLTTVSGLTDGTQGDGSGGAGAIEFGKDGDLTWTSPTDEVPFYVFGRSGFIYQISHSHASATFDSSVELTSLTCEYTGGFQDIQNVWDGVLVESVEARVYNAANSAYSIYSSQAIEAGGLATADYIYFNSQDPLFGIYLDINKTPNTTTTTVLDLVETWNGEAWTTVGASLDDGTAGGSKSGFVTWNRSVTPKKLNFNGSQYHSYWYRISFDKVLSSSLTWSILTMPYFNMVYPVVENIAAWDRRLWVCFNDNYLYGSAKFNPTGFNGDDMAIVPMGDHRSNKIKCMRKFYNFLLVWQEEKGSEGGSFSILQPGLNAAGYAAQIISPTIGIMNSKCAVVLEGVSMSDLNSERPIMTGAFFVSRSGIYKTDGSFVRNISGGISNYFDPEKSESIRAGYEDKHFLGFDSANGVLLLGIVSGDTATKPNKFFVFDPLTEAWTEDVWGYDISSVVEVGADSGNIPVIQLAGCQDGFVRRINIGNQDDGEAIVSNLVFEIDGNGKKIQWMEEFFRCKAETSGEIVRTVAIDGSTTFSHEKKLSQVPNPADKPHVDFKHRAGDGIMGYHLSIKYEHSTDNVPARYIEGGFGLDEITE